MSEKDQKHIIVLGAGVIGLQTAVLLSQSLQNYRITIIARHFPGDHHVDYISPYAGAHFRGGNEGPPFTQFETDTFLHWSSLLLTSNHQQEEIGVEFVPAVYYWDEYKPETCDKLWWSSLVPNFRILNKEELPDGVEYGVGYTTICINPDKYMKYLATLIPSNVSTMRCGKLESLRDVLDVPGLDKKENVVGIVNCTGLGALSLVPDENMFPTRGQTVLLRQITDIDIFRQAKDGQAWYIVRRANNGGTIIGGSRQHNDWNADIDDELTRRIMENCKKIAPEGLLVNKNDGDGEGKKEFDVVSVQVGRRPSRKGGVRVEVDEEVLEGERKWVVHQYGHSGSGFQTSYGSAKEAVRLVEGLTRGE